VGWPPRWPAGSGRTGDCIFLVQLNGRHKVAWTVCEKCTRIISGNVSETTKGIHDRATRGGSGQVARETLGAYALSTTIKGNDGQRRDKHENKKIK